MYTPRVLLTKLVKEACQTTQYSQSESSLFWKMAAELRSDWLLVALNGFYDTDIIKPKRNKLYLYWRSITGKQIISLCFIIFFPKIIWQGSVCNHCCVSIDMWSYVHRHMILFQSDYCLSGSSNDQLMQWSSQNVPTSANVTIENIPHSQNRSYADKHTCSRWLLIPHHWY